jgi:hypothetical protein
MCGICLKKSVDIQLLFKTFWYLTLPVLYLPSINICYIKSCQLFKNSFLRLFIRYDVNKTVYHLHIFTIHLKRWSNIFYNSCIMLHQFYFFLHNPAKDYFRHYVKWENEYKKACEASRELNQGMGSPRWVPQPKLIFNPNFWYKSCYLDSKETWALCDIKDNFIGVRVSLLNEKWFNNDSLILID